MTAVQKLGVRIKCSVEEQVLRNVRDLGNSSGQTKKAAADPKDVISEQRLNIQIYNNKKNMLPASVEFWEAVREHTKHEVAKQDLQTLITKNQTLRPHSQAIQQ